MDKEIVVYSYDGMKMNEPNKYNTDRMIHDMTEYTRYNFTYINSKNRPKNSFRNTNISGKTIKKTKEMLTKLG